jgi:hypothetical protein
MIETSLDTLSVNAGALQLSQDFLGKSLASNIGILELIVVRGEPIEAIKPLVLGPRRFRDSLRTHR